MAIECRLSSKDSIGKHFAWIPTGNTNLCTKDKIQMLTLTTLVHLVYYNASFNAGLINIVLPSFFCHEFAIANHPMSFGLGFELSPLWVFTWLRYIIVSSFMTTWCVRLRRGVFTWQRKIIRWEIYCFLGSVRGRIHLHHVSLVAGWGIWAECPKSIADSAPNSSEYTFMNDH